MQNRQDQFKLHYFYIPTFFEGHFGGSDTTPHMTRKNFLMKRVQTLYLGKVSECRFLNPIVFL